MGQKTHAINGQSTRRFKHYLIQAQVLVKTYMNRNHQNVQFSMGDFIYLCLRPYYLQPLAWCPQEAFPWYFWTFKVLEWIRAVAYCLELLASLSISCLLRIQQGLNRSWCIISLNGLRTHTHVHIVITPPIDAKQMTLFIIKCLFFLIFFSACGFYKSP